MRTNELEVNRRNTAAFITANPTVIQLIPRSRVKTGTGSRLVDQEPRALQTFRLIDQSAARGSTPGVVEAADGIQRTVEFQLLGEYDADLGLYDYWVDLDGIRLEIADLLPRNGYEVRAQVVRYGQA